MLRLWLVLIDTVGESLQGTTGGDERAVTGVGLVILGIFPVPGRELLSTSLPFSLCTRQKMEA